MILGYIFHSHPNDYLNHQKKKNIHDDIGKL